MRDIFLLDPTSSDPTSSVRGGGRFLQLIKDYIPEIKFINKPQGIGQDSVLVVPYWFPFHHPQIIKTDANKKVLVIFDVIPLKFPSHFPVGLKGKIFKWINIKNARSYDRILTISESSRKDIGNMLNIPKSKIFVCYLTTSKSFSNITAVKPKLNLTNQFCLYVGDVNWNKNLSLIARAIKKNSIPCVFAGGQFEKSNFRLIKNHHPWQSSFAEFLSLAKNDSRFIFQGKVTDQELKWLYKNAICNILVSHDEGFGLSYLESSSVATPTILSDIPVFHEISNDTSIFAKDNDYSTLSDEIKSLSQNTSRRNIFGKQAFERSKYFSPLSFRENFLNILDL